LEGILGRWNGQGGNGTGDSVAVSNRCFKSFVLLTYKLYEYSLPGIVYCRSTFSDYTALVSSDVRENEGHASVRGQMKGKGGTGRDMQQGKRYVQKQDVRSNAS